jgi:hypothetical protein
MVIRYLALRVPVEWYQVTIVPKIPPGSVALTAILMRDMTLLMRLLARLLCILAIVGVASVSRAQSVVEGGRSAITYFMTGNGSVEWHVYEPGTDRDEIFQVLREKPQQVYWLKGDVYYAVGLDFYRAPWVEGGVPERIFSVPAAELVGSPCDALDEGLGSWRQDQTWLDAVTGKWHIALSTNFCAEVMRGWMSGDRFFPRGDGRVVFLSEYTGEESLGLSVFRLEEKRWTPVGRWILSSPMGSPLSEMELFWELHDRVEAPFRRAVMTSLGTLKDQAQYSGRVSVEGVVTCVDVNASETPCEVAYPWAAGSVVKYTNVAGDVGPDHVVAPVTLSMAGNEKTLWTEGNPCSHQISIRAGEGHLLLSAQYSGGCPMVVDLKDGSIKTLTDEERSASAVWIHPLSRK